MRLYKSILKLKKIQIIKLCKILKINLHNQDYKNYTKKQLIIKLNHKLLNKFTLSQLKVLCENNKIIFYKNLKKQQLQNKIKYFINKNNKYNLINNFYYNLNNQNTSIKNNKILNNNQNNETFGITCEYTLCKIYKLTNKLENRINSTYIKQLTNTLNKFKHEFKNKYNLICYKYLGDKNQEIDFLCKNNKLKNNNISLSVKSNINNNNLCCPQNIGQCTKKSFVNNIKKYHYFKFNKLDLNTIFKIKKFIINNIYKLFNIYYKNLFKCNYLLWIKKNNININYQIIKKPNILKLNPKLFSFTKNIKTWKESNTLKYNNISIGVFQMHNNRNCIKFRFNLKNLLNLFK